MIASLFYPNPFTNIVIAKGWGRMIFEPVHDERAGCMIHLFNT